MTTQELPATRSAKTIAEGTAPLIREAWYVIAESAAVDRTLRGITVLGDPLVYYRSEAGDPIVLDGRCAHRRFPLAKSHLEGDNIKCGYHGFTYEPSGRCIFAPGVQGELKFGVRSYPSVERGGWLWVWTGDPQNADPADVPMPELDPQAEWTIIREYIVNPGNYLLLIENLNDLTHLHYLHGPQFADAAYANTPPEPLPVEDDRTVAWRKQVDSTLDVFSMWTGAAGVPVRQCDETYTVAPSLYYSRRSNKAVAPEDPAPTPGRAVIVHALTPENETSTHQFWQIALDAPTVMPVEEIAAFVNTQVFTEDVEAIRYQQHFIDVENRTGVVEHSIPSDQFGLRLRRMLNRMADRETRPGQS